MDVPACRRPGHCYLFTYCECSIGESGINETDKKHQIRINDCIMFRNYLLVSLRSIWRNKIFSLINIMGLVVGITAALAVYLLVHYENSYDKFQQNGDRVFRVVSDIYFSGDSVKNSG